MMTPQKKAWIWSGTIHGGVTVLIILGSILGGCRKSDPVEHVFEMAMDAIPDSAGGLIPGPSVFIPGQIGPQGGPVLPEITPTKIDLKSPKLPDSPLLPDQPTTPKSDNNKPVEPKKTSYTDFTQKNPVNTVTNRSKPTQTGRGSKPAINMGDILVKNPGGSGGQSGGLTGTGTGTGVATGSGQGGTAQFLTYQQMVKAMIDRNWDKPTDLYADKLYAIVIFSVSKYGVISNIRFERSSGNEVFDKTVRDAFARTGSVGNNPEGESSELRLHFKME